MQQLKCMLIGSSGINVNSSARRPETFSLFTVLYAHLHMRWQNRDGQARLKPCHRRTRSFILWCASQTHTHTHWIRTKKYFVLSVTSLCSECTLHMLHMSSYECRTHSTELLTCKLSRVMHNDATNNNKTSADRKNPYKRHGFCMNNRDTLATCREKKRERE